MSDSPTPIKLVVDCNSDTGLASTIPDILTQATAAAAAGDVDQTNQLLELARQRAADAANAVPIETVVPLDEDELADLAAREQAAIADAAAATAQAWIELRMKRDRWLAQTDAFFADPLPSDFPADKAADIQANLDAWKAFRQALRDLPANTSNPNDVSWPAPPAAPQVYLT